MINDRRNAVVGAESEKFGLELVTLSDIDTVDFVGKRELLERNGNFMPVGCRGVVQFDHAAVHSLICCVTHVSMDHIPVL